MSIFVPDSLEVAETTSCMSVAIWLKSAVSSAWKTIPAAPSVFRPSSVSSVT